MQNQSLNVILRAQDTDRIGGDSWRARHFGHKPSVRTPEPQLTAGLTVDLVTLLVDGAMVAPAQHREVRERRRSSLRPMPNVMALTEAHFTARKTTTVVAMVQRAA